MKIIKLNIKELNVLFDYYNNSIKLVKKNEGDQKPPIYYLILFEKKFIKLKNINYIK